jgi:hypothetical protein
MAISHIHLIINICLKNEGQEGKTGPVQGWLPEEAGRVNREGEGGRCTVYT